MLWIIDYKIDYRYVNICLLICYGWVNWLKYFNFLVGDYVVLWSVFSV